MSTPPSPVNSTPAPIHEPDLWAALATVMDPEIGLNIVDLGLVYDVCVEGAHVRVVMTVTTPGCPMIHSLTFGVETALLDVAGVGGVQVDVVHEPPWSPAMIRPEARAAAGIRA